MSSVASEIIKTVVTDSKTSMHAMSLKAGIAYATVHSWMKGTNSPTVDNLNKFLEANGYRLVVEVK